MLWGLNAEEGMVNDIHIHKTKEGKVKMCRVLGVVDIMFRERSPEMGITLGKTALTVTVCISSTRDNIVFGWGNHRDQNRDICGVAE